MPRGHSSVERAVGNICVSPEQFTVVERSFVLTYFPSQLGEHVCRRRKVKNLLGWVRHLRKKGHRSAEAREIGIHHVDCAVLINFAAIELRACNALEPMAIEVE